MKMYSPHTTTYSLTHPPAGGSYLQLKLARLVCVWVCMHACMDHPSTQQQPQHSHPSSNPPMYAYTPTNSLTHPLLGCQITKMVKIYYLILELLVANELVLPLKFPVDH